MYIHHKSGDDGQTLFGVPDFATLQFFEMLISVTGVGPKMALTIVSAAKISMLEDAIARADTAIFTRMSGVGKKTAERIILELKNKAMLSSPLESQGSSDIYDALINLGYSPREVRIAIPKLDSTQPMETQLKEALKLLAQ
jgi:Holliday junction DNA helicase RuvA